MRSVLIDEEDDRSWYNIIIKPSMEDINYSILIKQFLLLLCGHVIEHVCHQI